MNNNNNYIIVIYCILITLDICLSKPYTWINKIVTECELEALSIGTRLSDQYSSYDEQTEWDVRIHHEYLVKYMGFAGWIQMGLWPHTGLTANRRDAKKLHRVILIDFY